MSLQSGKTLGLISSLILVILPVVVVAVMVSYIAIILSMIPAGVTSGTVPSFAGLAGLSAGLGITFIALGVFAIIAVILLLIGMYFLSQYYQEPGIFKNILYALILTIVTGVGAVVAEFALLIPASVTISQSSTTNPSSFFGSGFFIGLIAILVVAIVMSIISAVLVMRSFNKLGEKSEVGSFKTAGLLYLIGNLLSIIGIGVIILWIGYIFAAIGFYRLKPLPTAPAAVTYPSEAPPNLPTKRCPYCSTENVVGATYCRFCGKPLQ